MPKEDTDWRMEGTGRLNSTGSSGTLTVPQAVREHFMTEHGRDYAVFVQDEKILFVPTTEVDVK